MHEPCFKNDVSSGKTSHPTQPALLATLPAWPFTHSSAPSSTCHFLPGDLHHTKDNLCHGLNI